MWSYHCHLMTTVFAPLTSIESPIYHPALFKFNASSLSVFLHACIDTCTGPYFHKVPSVFLSPGHIIMLVIISRLSHFIQYTCGRMYKFMSYLINPSIFLVIKDIQFKIMKSFSFLIN